MKAWERRLRDLWTILENCHSTYMEPELFRLNTNQFLQTSRTVTFIIQKNKDTIPNFDSWYQNNVQKSWKTDKVMTWAIDARNLIEKEGDLELHSRLELTLFFSYLMEQDIKIQCGRAELLNAGTKKLLRHAQKKLPSHVIESSAIKIERYWVANSLPDWELLSAMSYIYNNMHDCCHKLSLHLGTKLDPTISSPSELEPEREIARQTRYLKLSDLNIHSTKNVRIHVDEFFSPDGNLKAALHDLKKQISDSDTIEKTLYAFSNMAEQTFLHYGNHVPMLFFFNKEWKVIGSISAQFNDTAEKYIFWRGVTDRIRVLGATGIAWICEAWIRDGKKLNSDPINKLPITGERLQVNVLCNDGKFVETQWEIVRPEKPATPTLRKLTSEDSFKQIPYYLAPTMHVLGVPYPEGFLDSATG